MATAVAHSSLTEQQSKAVCRRETSIVLSSGAGCGKTHVLTQRYLSHLREDGAEVGQIVAITFTERAARQMRDRIRRAIVQKLRIAPEGEEVDRWANHLRGLETAQISTIHAFCANLLRQHAVEAGVDPRFEVLEDYLAANLETQALTSCLQRLLTAEDQAGTDLRELVLLYGWKPTVAALQHVLGQWDEERWGEWLERPAAAIAEEWLGPVRGKLLPAYVHYLTAASPKIARCLWLLRTTPCQGPKMAANVAHILELTPMLAGATDLEAAVKEVTEAAKVVGTEKAKAWASEEVYEAVKTGFEHFRRELPAQLELFLESAKDLNTAALTGQRFLRVATEAALAYRQLKRRTGVVDFQGLLVLARNLVRDHPEVRERLRRRMRFLLIDELQDTDPVQMELVEHLCGAELTQGKLFAVGDHAQSIYRFRGADVQLFQDLKRRMPHEGRLGLTLNFRSQPAILDFVNALLGPCPDNGEPASAAFPSGLEDYEPLKPHHGQVNPGPCIEFLWAPREAKENVTEARKTEADWIARRIAAMVNRGERLVADRSGDSPRLRPVRQGDVVLLFRAMSNVELYEAALRRHGLNYYLVGGRAFFAQQEIYDLLNLLRALENPHDAVSLAGTLRSPFCCLSDEALFLLGRNESGLWAGLHDPATLESLPAGQRERADRARRNLDRWRALKDRLPIARLLGDVFADTGFDAATQFEFLGDRKLANLWKLVDLARNFDRSGLFGMAEFIQRLGDLVRTQPREEQAATQPENADVVRLMTIHQAKGLEFPVVIVPDVGAEGGGPHNPVAHWDGRLGCVTRPPAEEPPPFPALGWRLWKAAEAVDDWREDLRTLYVACTRAEDNLILSAALPRDYSPGNAWMLQLAERFDLKHGDCLTVGLSGERRPRVRVTDSQAPPPSAPASPGPAATRAGDTPENPLLPTLARSLANRDYSLVDGQKSDLIDSVALRDLSSGQAASPLYWGVIPFDAEDGSDRTDWLPPRERWFGNEESEKGQRDRILRAVLERWDFQDPAGWRPVLQQTLEAQSMPGIDEGLREELERSFERFAQSDTCRQLAAARVCRREVEFCLQGKAGEEASPSSSCPLIRGIIDCIWQDAGGDWHMLAWDTDPVQPDRKEKDWRDRKYILLLWAAAFYQALGVRPRTMSRYCLADGAFVSRESSPLREGEVRVSLQRLTSAREGAAGEEIA
jgi:ATP-dependent helicase/nuclease subunit A